MSSTVLLVHVGVTLVLVGLIWTIQLVHYPMFADVGADAFPAYHTEHGTRISVLVMPLMLVELLTAGWLLVARPAGVPAEAAIVGMVLVLTIWASTFLLSVPAHEALAGGFDEAAWRRLVHTNWVRTLAWTVRGAGALWVLGRM